MPKINLETCNNVLKSLQTVSSITLDLTNAAKIISAYNANYPDFTVDEIRNILERLMGSKSTYILKQQLIESFLPVMEALSSLLIKE